jgi:phenylacetaldehyde dehydrogenase
MAIDIRDKETVSLGTQHLLIGGARVPAASGRTFESLDPATEQIVADVAEGDAEDIDRAVRTARAALESGPWARTTPSERARIIHRIGDLILEHGAELAYLETIDNGKPLAMAKAVDVPLSADQFHYMSGWATKLNGETISPSVSFMPGAEFHAYTLRQPIGVVGQIIPWNFPLLMAAWKLAPALAAGCTVVLKPAEQTPLTALRLGELLLEAGVPDGVVNVVPGFGHTAGAALAAHPDVDKVAFTGSTEVGRMIVQASAGNLKKVSLELGGKSPNIIFADADVEAAIAGAASAIFFNQGEACTAGSRLFVEEPIYDAVVSGVASVARGIKLGAGLDADTEMGPLISSEQRDRVCGFLDAGRGDGVEVVCGGGRPEGAGYFVEPTVLTGTAPEMSVEAEEIFGPVVAIKPFKDTEDLVAAANDTIYGLAAGVWTSDFSRAHRMARRLNAGSVWINGYNILDPALPFGGFKQSGWGRENAREVLDLYTTVKTVCGAL